MAQEAPGNTLQPTALVHEAWLRLVTPEEAQFQNRAHFFGAAAEAMRRILVDRAREKKALKRGGHFERLDLEGLELVSPMPDDELLALDESLERLTTVDARAAAMVKLCFFVGLTHAEAHMNSEFRRGLPSGCGDLPVRGFCARCKSKQPNE